MKRTDVAVPHFKRGGLAASQVRLTLLVALVTGLLMAATQILLDYQSSNDSVERQLQQVISSTTPAATEAVWTLSTDLADGVTGGLINHPQIIAARIETSTGTQLSARARTPPPATRPSLDFLFARKGHLTEPLNHDDDQSQTIGYLYLTIDTTEVRREFIGRVSVILASGVIKALLLASTLLFLFYLTLTRPIQRYAHWVTRIEPEKPEDWTLKPPERVQQDELTALGETAALRFQEARRYFLQLQHTRNELKRINHELEERVQQRTEELERALARAEHLASTDELTGLANRRHFMKLALKRHAEWLRHRNAFSLVMLDIDLFKSVNDRFGHPAGDHVLREVANLLRSHTRSEDLCGRLGGEEFCLLLVTDPEGAQRQTERLRRALENHRIRIGESFHSITASFGIAWCTDPTAPFDELVKAADEALYRAKNKGRNRIETYHNGPNLSQPDR